MGADPGWHRCGWEYRLLAQMEAEEEVERLLKGEE